MRDFLRLWNLELRRGRWILAAALAAIGFAVLIWYAGTRPDYERIAIGFLTFCALVFIGCFVSSDVVTRDFKEKTIGLYLALPIPDWKLYLSKYLASLFVFAGFVTLPLVLLVSFCFASSIADDAGFFAVALPVALLMLIHAAVFVSTIMLRGEGSVLFGIILTPLVLLLLWPGASWFYYPDQHHNELDPLGFCIYVLGWTLFFIIAGLRFWIVGIARGRSLLKPGMIFGLTLVGTSVALWSVFHAIDITDYLVTLRKFETTPGVEIVKGSFRVPEAIMKFNAKGSCGTEDLLALDFTREVSIPPEAYPAYCRKLGEFREALFRAYMHELSTQDAARLIPILRLEEKYPPESIPMLAVYRRRENSWHPVPESRDFELRTGRGILHFYLPVPGLTDFLAALPRQSAGKLRVLAAPRDNVVIASDGTSYSGAHPDPLFPSDESLRNVLPGADREGWARLVAVIEWVLKRNLGEQPFRGSELRKSTDTMKLLLAALAAEHELNIAVRPAEIPDHIRNFLLNRPQRSLTAQTRSIVNYCLNLPYLRLREYLKTTGKLPDDPAIILTPEEKGRLELCYCGGEHRNHRPVDKTESGRIFLHASFTGLPKEQCLCLELFPAKDKREEAHHE